jgi:cell division protein ZapA (FtsZ GTPase activity inhibitor)
MTGNTATTAQAGDQPSPRTAAIRQGRQADSARRRQRVIAVLGRAATDGTELTASGIARAAGVDRSFLYRHRDLLDKIHALEATPPAHPDTCGPAVTRASLQADLLAAGERAQRLNGRVRQLEKRLSEILGEKAWQESGLGVPADVDALNQKISHLEQQAIDLRLQLEERDQDLAAARTANRELIAQLNTATRHR